MPDLKFKIVSAQAVKHALAPTLGFHLQITNSVENEEVFAAALKCQIMIDAVKRPYDEVTQERLFQVFGETEKWRESLQSIFWKSVTISVPRFAGSTTVEVPLSCSEDMAVTADQYFYSLEEGTVPLSFYFSGSVFYRDSDGSVQLCQLPWDQQVDFQLPVSRWRKMMQLYYPDSKWVRIDRDLYDQINEHRIRQAHPSMEACLRALLKQGPIRRRRAKKTVSAGQ